MASYVDVTNTLDFAVSFKPSSAFPIDSRTMFGSYESAQAAAQTAVNAGSSESIYYFGMPLTVFANDEATMYIINGDKTLKEVGKMTYGDDKSVVLDANSGKLSLKSFGVEYYAYNDADTIIESGDYTYPDNMPLDPVDGAFVQIGETWYKYSDGSWAESETAGSSVPYYTLTTGWKAGLEPRVIGDSSSGFALAWYEPSTTTVEGLQSTLGTLQTALGELTNRVGVAENDIDAVEGRVGAVEQSINTLNGEAATPGSVKNTVNAAIAEVVAGADTSFDTLKEIADWISSHSDSASAMNSAIVGNTNAINALGTLVGEIPEGATSNTVVEYIAEAIDDVEDTLGTAAYANTTDFATAAQGAKADSAVQSVIAGDTNGYIKVDNVAVKVYEAPVASTSVSGTIKVDGTSLTVVDGVASVLAIDAAKVTNLNTTIGGVVDEKIEALDLSNTYLPKSDVVASGDLNASVDDASDLKAASEKALVNSLTWKTSM